ncbi:uncharacterized protein LOC127260456 [Andrographis paniculata]|uniref:uncharacterized protein LOC127260456 n=1 Tax=Andrographis paniculata TaxID=175694 RepID=UPI0021E8F181|nr:uncharacterized protein LOC127260456 [Andrographis paniculata]
MAGGTPGHVALGFAFLLIGIWHLFNSIKIHSLNPTSFRILPWFPAPRFRRLEPILIMAVTAAFISMELFHGRKLLSPDGTIPSSNLPHLEHSIIALSFFVYAAFAAVFDGGAPPPPASHGLLHFLQAAAFAQQLLILHLHSTDHMGIEGQYHWLLQTVAAVSAATTVVAIGFPGSFVNSFIRAFSVVFQGVWLVVIGAVLWTPRWIPAGCALKRGPGRDAVVCGGDGALDRAKALVNIQFGLYLVVLSAASILFYLAILKLYPNREKIEYRSLQLDQEHSADDHIKN